MERNSPLTLRQILARLSDILALKQTGTFFIATDQNTSCRFAIESGKLTRCTHRREQGLDAIQSLLEIGGGSCSFSENQFSPFRPEAAIDHLISLEMLEIQPQPPTPAPSVKPEKPEAKAEQKPTPTVRYYRGQPIEVQSAPTASIPEEQRRASPSPSTPTKKRYYRGNLIED